jgi:hypothetical protein
LILLFFSSLIVINIFSSKNLSINKVALLILCVFLIFGRQATWGTTSEVVDKFVFNPKIRSNLLEESSVTQVVKNILEPTRSISIGGVVFSGYRATIGLESIDGPDALQSKRYKDLTDILSLPYPWDWRMDFNEEDVKKFRNPLSFLGVGVVFTNHVILDKYYKLINNEPRLYAYALEKDPWPRAFFINKVNVFENPNQMKTLVENGNLFLAFYNQDMNSELSKYIETINNLNLKEVVSLGKNYSLTANTTSFDIEVPTPGFIYVGEADEKDSFIFYLDGQKINYFPANYAFKSIFVDKPGLHKVTVEYWPKNFNFYLFLSFLGIVPLFLSLLVNRKFKKELYNT